jgi:hypothetical protein
MIVVTQRLAGELDNMSKILDDRPKETLSVYNSKFSMEFSDLPLFKSLYTFFLITISTTIPVLC